MSLLRGWRFRGKVIQSEALFLGDDFLYLSLVSSGGYISFSYRLSLDRSLSLSISVGVRVAVLHREHRPKLRLALKLFLLLEISCKDLLAKFCILLALLCGAMFGCPGLNFCLFTLAGSVVWARSVL